MNTTLSVLELLEMHINYEVKSCINGTWQYLRTIGKEVILLCERDKRAGLPFDISGYRTIFYENTMVGKDKIEKEVETYLEEALKRQGIL